MDFDYSDRTREYMESLSTFMNEHIFPAEAIYEEEVSEPVLTRRRTRGWSDQS